MIDLSPNTLRMLESLAEEYGSERVSTIAEHASRVGMTRGDAREALHILAREGLAEHIPFCNDEYSVFGSGYVATQRGYDQWAKIENPPCHKEPCYENR